MNPKLNEVNKRHDAVASTSSAATAGAAVTTADATLASTDLGDAAKAENPNLILGLPAPAFIVMTILVLGAVSLTPGETGMTLGFAVTLFLGSTLMWLGNRLSFLEFIGGGVILCILGPALLDYFGLFPENLITLIESFYATSGFGEFVVAALITGSILGMPRQLLIQAGSRIIVPIIAVIIGCFALIALLGVLLGEGAGYALFFVAGPVLGGGVAAGAIPISEIIGTQTGQDPSTILSSLVPAVAIANIICILSAGGMNLLGTKKPNLFTGFNGHGILPRAAKLSTEEGEHRLAHTDVAIKAAVVGFAVAGALYAIANLISSWVPSIHAYVFLILLCAILKISGLTPQPIEEAADLWYVFVANSMIAAILVSLSIVAIDIEQITALLGDPKYMFMTFMTVMLAILIGGAVGWLVKLHFIESAISAGLGLADFGSSGDLAVLQASKRLKLLPFLSISSRIGGGIVLVFLSALAPMFL